MDKMALVGMIERFDVNSDKWFEYVEILEQYFIANGIEDTTKKKGILLTVIGNETYQVCFGIYFHLQNQLIKHFSN